MATQSTIDPEKSLTVIIRRTAQPGKEKQLEEWFSGISKVAHTFPGHMGETIIRPTNKANREYVIILRFDSFENLDAWQNSPERAVWLEKVNDITVGEADIKTVPGMEYWFELPECPAANAPPKWKMALVIFVVLTPLVILIGSISSTFFSGIHFHLRQIVSILTTVILMTWIVMPLVTKLLAPWLYKVKTKKASS